MFILAVLAILFFMIGASLFTVGASYNHLKLYGAGIVCLMIAIVLMGIVISL